MRAMGGVGCGPMPRAPLRGVLDWITGTSVTSAIQASCPQQASNVRAPIDNNRTQIENWTSTGYYTPDEVDMITGHQLDVMHAARGAVSQAYADVNATDYPDAKKWLDTVTANLNAVESQTMDYINAVKAARDNGDDAIAAPELQNWAVETLRRVGDAVETSYLVECNKPAWLGLFTGITNACETFAAAVVAVVGVVITVATKVGEATERTFTAVAWIASHAPLLVGIGLALVGAGFAYRHREKIRGLFKRRAATAR